MALSKAHLAQVNAFFKAQESDVISADDLTDLINQVNERELSAKTVRAYLRKIKARDQKQFKNATWRIDATLATQAVERFSVKAS